LLVRANIDLYHEKKTNPCLFSSTEGVELVRPGGGCEEDVKKVGIV
jgi:hypothetical protein